MLTSSNVLEDKRLRLHGSDIAFFDMQFYSAQFFYKLCSTALIFSKLNKLTLKYMRENFEGD